MVSRFNGLMRHLKNNSERDDHTKQVMMGNVEALVPEEYEDLLQSEFERRCSFGDRLNTELMSSAKWVKVLKDCGAVLSPDADKRSSWGCGAIPLAEADVIFYKVLHDCDYGGKRITYDLFCKALYLVARAARPDLSYEGAFNELLQRIAMVAPEDPNRVEAPDLMLDPNVMLHLEHFKPALYDLFKTFCSRNLGNPSNARPGSGTIRQSERTYWKHTQDMTGLTSMARSSYRATNLSMNGGLEYPSGEFPSKKAVAPLNATPVEEESSFCTRADDDSGYDVPASGTSMEAVEQLERDILQVEGDMDSVIASQNAEADAGGGYAEAARRPHSPLPLQEQDDMLESTALQAGSQAPAKLYKADHVDPIFEDNIPQMTGGIGMGGGSLIPMSSTMVGGPLRSGNTIMASSDSMYKDPCTGLSQDPYEYANGAPVIKNRRRHMSFDQMMLLCKELKIVPDLLSRTEVSRIFKRAQCSGSHNSHGSSLHGFLSLEAFIDAAGQLALEAYAHQPYNEEYPEPHEKIHAFFVNILRDSCNHRREVHDRFLYGCSGRGR
jgi:hypothetical protein